MVCTMATARMAVVLVGWDLYSIMALSWLEMQMKKQFFISME